MPIRLVFKTRSLDLDFGNRSCRHFVRQRAVALKVKRKDLKPKNLTFFPKALSAHQTTPTIILPIFDKRRSLKSRRDSLLQCNSRHLLLPSRPITHAGTTMWQSRTATVQPWWRRHAAPSTFLLEASTSGPPCRPPSPAPATQSRFTFTLMTGGQSLVGGSPGEQWHQVPEHLYIRLSDSLRSCL